MIDNPCLSDAQTQVDLGSKHRTYGSHLFARTTMAALLGVATIAMIATSLAQFNKGATARSGGLVATAHSAPPLLIPLDSGEVRPFAFGYLVFEDDRDNGVPGFGPLPPSSAR